MNDHKPIGDKWGNKKAPIDKDLLWNKIMVDDEFPKEEKRHSSIIKFSMLLFFLLILLIVVESNWGFDENNELDSDSDFYSSVIKHEDRKSNDIKITNKNLIDSQLITEVDFSKVINQASGEKNKINEGLVKGNSKSLNDEFHLIASFKSNNSSKLVNSFISSDDRQIQNGKILKPAIIEEYEIDVRNNFNESKVRLDENAEIISSGIINKPFGDLLKATNEEVYENERSAGKTDKSLVKDYSAIDIDFNPALPLIKLSSLGLSLIELTKVDNIFAPSFVEIKNEGSRIWKLSFMSGVGVDNHSITNNLSEPSEAFTNWSENTRKYQSEYFNLSLSKNIGKSYVITAEFEIQNMFQLFEKHVETNNTIVRNENPKNGFYSNLIESVNYSLYHKYQFFGINTLIEKEFNIGKLSILPGIGLNVNIRQTITGELYNDNQVRSSVSDFDSYDERSDFTGFASLKLLYPINTNFDILLTSRYYKRRGLTLSGMEFNHNVDSYNLNIGFSYNFN